MPILLEKKINSFHTLGIWKVNESKDYLFSLLPFDSTELEAYQRINNEQRRVHWLASRVLLAQLAKDNYLKISYTSFGKPYLSNSTLKISISHSYEYVAISINNKEETGIDIELIKTKIDRIAAKFMHKDEMSSLKKNTVDQLYVYWCAKEALFKLNGKKGVSFKENIFIEPFEYQQKGKLMAKINSLSGSDSFILCYEKINEYMLVYVLNNIKS